jgi:Flp pilus assembly protein TadG
MAITRSFSLRTMLRQRRGNVMMMFALALAPLTCSIGMGVDYARAMKSQTKLNAIADAAALLAVSKSAMQADDGYAAYVARQFFVLQSASLIKSSGITLSNLTIQAPTDASGRRTATVSYRATSSNVFARVMGLNNLTISGKSATTNATAPDIDFYMLLDVSNSMALPTTTAGLAKVAASNSSGCQFACHTVTGTPMGRDRNGNMTDLYGVAKSYGLPLRIDEEGRAVSKLAANATSTSSKNGADYRIAIATFRGQGAFSILQRRTDRMADAAQTTQDLVPYQFYKNGCPTSACKTTDPGYGDNDTAVSDAMEQMNSQLITDPGTGINRNAPQAVMFIVTDGVRDERRTNNQPEVVIDTAKCDMIKARGVRIAVLYTEYLPESLTGNRFGQSAVAPYLYKVEPALKACASAGLYTKVTTDQDIYSALDALFQNAVATARITN